MQRRQLLGVLAGAVSAAWLPAVVAQGPAASGGNKPQIEVWKDPDCGCCKEWVTHLEANGFAARVNDIGNAAAQSAESEHRKRNPDVNHTNDFLG